MTEDLPYPGGECAADVIRRAGPVLERLAESGHERIAVVTHGGVIRTMAAWYLGMPLENGGFLERIWKIQVSHS